MTIDNDTRAHLVLGAGGGIGAATARRLAARGDGALLAGRGEESLRALGLDLDLPFAALDATRTDEVERAALRVVDTWGRLDGIVNAVGSVLLKPAHATSDEEWDATIATNLRSAFAAVRAAGKVMRTGGSIVLLSSAAARTGLPNHEAIAAAKAGVIGLTLSAAATYAPRGLRVNAIAPGLVETKLTERITGSAVGRSASIGMHALGRLGRLGRPDDIASAACWLLDPE